MVTSSPWATFTASPTSASHSVTATTPTAVSSTHVKSRVCEPSPKITGARPAAKRPTNFGITSALLPAACSRGPYELNGRITGTGRREVRMHACEHTSPYALLAPYTVVGMSGCVSGMGSSTAEPYDSDVET